MVALLHWLHRSCFHYLNAGPGACPQWESISQQLLPPKTRHPLDGPMNQSQKTSLENKTLELPRTWKYIRSRSCLRPLWMNRIFKKGVLLILPNLWLKFKVHWSNPYLGWDCSEQIPDGTFFSFFSGFKLPQHVALIGRIALKVCFLITSPQNQRWKKQCKSSKLNMFSSSLLNRDP